MTLTEAERAVWKVHDMHARNYPGLIADADGMPRPVDICDECRKVSPCPTYEAVAGAVSALIAESEATPSPSPVSPADGGVS